MRIAKTPISLFLPRTQSSSFFSSAGPKSKLDDTVHAQPALFVAGLAAVEKLRAENPAAADSASAAAGLSLGEYTALVFAGALSFEDGLKIVKVRAESMAAAAGVGSHGMLSVVGLGDKELEAMCTAAAAKAGPGCV
jgi:[acyl-carrier-protein] S-malonyltransferase